jgi:isoleucyl-tRNA synthetase
MRAIVETRWVPEKGRNRIASMVSGRPDWVISRQRAWGVPITLFVDRRTGQYLNDPAVNARIVEAFRADGVEAWTEARAAGFLGPDRDPADYERVTDILDVWFDSGSTHAFVLASGEWPELSWPADLYLEGSDQHRGWFQSSLLESCGTRGRAPYDTVLTHGFTMDAKGLKMSKSLGNTVDPVKLTEETGADILRLWALSIDSADDHRIGREILAGVGDAYRKLRNSFRYLLGALDGFTEEERADIADMADLERYMLHRLVGLDESLREALEAYEFPRYVRLLADFCNDELSAFYFDIRKDSLYCDAAADPKRRGYRTVLDVLFHALVRWLAPVLVFTAEEAWGTRYPERGSVHLLEWPAIDPDWREPKLAVQWDELKAIREVVNAEIEPKRRAKEIGSSLEARVVVGLPDMADRPNVTGAELAEILIVSEAVTEPSVHGPIAVVHRTDLHKCGRCWRHLPEVGEDGSLCGRCAEVTGG